MSAIANTALAAFEKYKDHPVVKALVTFLDEQKRLLEDVVTWSCELEKINTNYYHLLETFEFDVLFKDKHDLYTGLRGTIQQLADGTCMVHVFRHYYIREAD